jgi:SAM-dependent methyltransferase
LEHISEEEALRIEDTLWWLRGRKAIIKRYMVRAAARGQSCQSPTIMDIGCGSGGNLGVLADFGRVIGVEPSETLAHRARKRCIAEAIFSQDVRDLNECHEVDIFTMFDVLEHIKHDSEFLGQLRDKAAHPHYLLISVPACQFMFGDHDRLLHHHRRYSSKMLRQALEEAGYRVREMSYFMFLLFPLALLARMKDRFMAMLGRKRATVELGDLPHYLGTLFSLTLRIEALVSKKMRFPVGLWLFALAASPDDR